MPRLPWDQTTQRAGWVAFASLGLAGIMVVAFPEAPKKKLVAANDYTPTALAGRTRSLALAALADDIRFVTSDFSGQAGPRAVVGDFATGMLSSACNAGLGPLPRWRLLAVRWPLG